MQTKKKKKILGSSCDFPVDKHNCPNATDVTIPRLHTALNFFRSDDRHSTIRTHSRRKFKARERRRRSQHVYV